MPNVKAVQGLLIRFFQGTELLYFDTSLTDHYNILQIDVKDFGAKLTNVPTPEVAATATSGNLATEGTPATQGTSASLGTPASPGNGSLPASPGSPSLSPTASPTPGTSTGIQAPAVKMRAVNSRSNNASFFIDEDAPTTGLRITGGDGRRMVQVQPNEEQNNGNLVHFPAKPFEK